MDIARGSAWLVVAIYVAALILEIRGARSEKIRVVWSIGAASLLAHIGWTLLIVHQGSLAVAYEHTARQTQQLIGIRIGEGLYVNFAMFAIWMADAIAWWAVPSWNHSRRRFLAPMHATFIFLFFNATVVFGTTAGRAMGLAAIAIVIGTWLFRPAKPISTTHITD